MEETVRETWNLMIEVVVTYGLDVVGAILILIVGWWIAGRSRAWTRMALEKTGRVDAMLTGFLAAAVRYTVLILTVLAVLDRFGVETTSFVAILGATGIAILGATGIAIGLALQGTLSNVAAGVMILLLRPFKVGDFIEGAGHSGTVKEVSLFVTHIATPDNVGYLSFSPTPSSGTRPSKTSAITRRAASISSSASDTTTTSTGQWAF